MSTSILIGLVIERIGLHHRDKTRLDLEILPSSADLRPNSDIGSRGSRVRTERVLGHTIGCGWRNGD